jgi:polar amino acid transport system substrate-binding protein
LAIALGLALHPGRTDARGLRVIAEAFPTIAEVAPDGSLRGVGVEIVQQIAARLGTPISIAIIPWGRSLAQMQHGDADILIGPYPTPDRAAYMDFSTQAIYRAKVVLFAQADKHATWSGNLQDLRGLKIGTTLAWYYGAKFNDHRDSLVLDTSVQQPDAFRMLVRGRVDLVITTESAGQAAIDQLGIVGQVTELSPPVDILEGHIGFAKSPEMTAVRQAFDRELDALAADGTVARLNQKYGRFY